MSPTLPDIWPANLNNSLDSASSTAVPPALLNWMYMSLGETHARPTLSRTTHTSTTHSSLDNYNQQSKIHNVRSFGMPDIPSYHPNGKTSMNTIFNPLAYNSITNPISTSRSPNLPSGPFGSSNSSSTGSSFSGNYDNLYDTPSSNGGSSRLNEITSFLNGLTASDLVALSSLTPLDNLGGLLNSPPPSLAKNGFSNQNASTLKNGACSPIHSGSLDDSIGDLTEHLNDLDLDKSYKNRELSPNYLCHLCFKKGHHIKECPKISSMVVENENDV